MSSPQPAAAQQAAMAPPRRSRLSSVFVGGVFSTGVLLWTLTNRLEMPVSGAPGFRHIQHSKQSNTGCECLLDLHCPRYNFDYPQEKETYCKIYRFPLRSTQSCLKWRDHQFGRSTHIVLLGDLRLLYLYRYIRDELMSESERVEGPAYCRSVHKNWTHPYLQEAAAAVQPPEPCRHLAMNRLAKLEYLWTADSLWPDILQRLIDRCRLGVCPSVLVVSSRLDLALRDHEDKRELSMSAVSEHVRRVRPLLELLRSYGVPRLVETA
ncbi:uncharacterized protein LOC119091862 [Pollicipes pollicipes]|uniref:uncharacterized protein LOC119091862 n=1 Tax=Pollicipes pollicipes TaxID=41117 RepID=UPI0018850ADD|nr:uncharacterized protein LOC119091862 [Pollicipes pollicipes]